MTHSILKKSMLAAVATATIGLAGAPVWADNPVQHTLKGLSTTLSTPSVVLDKLADAEVGEAMSSAITLPVKGTVATLSGGLQSVCMVGAGTGWLIQESFESTGEFIGEANRNLNSNLP